MVQRRDGSRRDSIGPLTTQYRRCGPARLRRHTGYWLSEKDGYYTLQGSSV